MRYLHAASVQCSTEQQHPAKSCCLTIKIICRAVKCTKHVCSSAKAHPGGTVSACALRSAAIGVLRILAAGLCAVARAWGGTSCSSSRSLVPSTSHGPILQRCGSGQQVQLADQGAHLSNTNAEHPGKQLHPVCRHKLSPGSEPLHCNQSGLAVCSWARSGQQGRWSWHQSHSSAAVHRTLCSLHTRLLQPRQSVSVRPVLLCAAPQHWGLQHRAKQYCRHHSWGLCTLCCCTGSRR